jgi:hypothetical protein
LLSPNQKNKVPPIAVSDEATAVKIADKALIKIYGKRQIESEKPFSASLAGGVFGMSQERFAARMSTVK